MEHGQKVILDTLNDIVGTLKRIEQKLNAKEQHEVIKEAVSHALQGSKYKTTPKDLVKVMNKDEEITEILYQQLQLLAEKSKDKDISAKDLCNISDEIDRLTETIYGLTSD